MEPGLVSIQYVEKLGWPLDSRDGRESQISARLLFTVLGFSGVSLGLQV